MITIDTSSSSSATSTPEPPPSGITTCPFTVLYDQQEGHPWTFQGLVIGGKQVVVPREKVHLKTGNSWSDGKLIPGAWGRGGALGDETRQDLTGQDATRPDLTRRDPTGHDMTGRDATRRDRTGRDSTRQDENF